jgi:NitT/TauT family transport system ATP-binding protein
VNASPDGASLGSAQASEQAAIEVKGVSKSFTGSTGTVEVLDGISFVARPGEFVVLVGPSGCGKSTVLNMIAGLDHPSDGSVTYDGRGVEGPNVGIGYMSQGDSLLPWRNVLRNVSLPLEITGVGKAERKELAEKALADVGLTGFESHFPHQLSGGMRKRAQLARTLIYNPKTLLMDEPFGSLDALLRLKMQEQLLEIWERDRRTVIYVTHDLDEAVGMADRVLVFSSRPASLIGDHAVTIPRPRDLWHVRSTEAFSSLREELWGSLRSEVR